MRNEDHVCRNEIPEPVVQSQIGHEDNCDKARPYPIIARIADVPFGLHDSGASCTCKTYLLPCHSRPAPNTCCEMLNECGIWYLGKVLASQKPEFQSKTTLVVSRGNLVSGGMDAWELKWCVESGLYEGRKGVAASKSDRSEAFNRRRCHRRHRRHRPHPRLRPDA